MIDLSPLRESRPFRLLWFGQLVSLSGTQLRLVAIPYQIYLLTGSSLDVGLIGLFQAIPLISLALFGGVIADRVNRRRLLIVTQVGLAGCSAALAIGTQLGVASVPFLYATNCEVICSHDVRHPPLPLKPPVQGIDTRHSAR